MNFSGYAENLPGTVLDQLYQSLYVCQAILHSLPPLAKQYVVRMLHAHAIPAGEQFGAWRAVCRWHHFRAYRVRADWVHQWGSPHSLAKHKAAVDKLTHLQLLKHSSSQRASRLDSRGAVFDLAMTVHTQTAPSDDLMTQSLTDALTQATAAEMLNQYTPCILTFRSNSRQPRLAMPGSLSRCGYATACSCHQWSRHLSTNAQRSTAVSHSFLAVFRSSQSTCCWQPHLLSNWRSMPGPIGRYCF